MVLSVNQEAGMAELDERIIRLETKIAYQDDLIQQLNEVVIGQQQH